MIRKTLLTALVAVVAFSTAGTALAKTISLTELVELFISLGIIAPDKIEPARAAVQNYLPKPPPVQTPFCFTFTRNLRVGDSGPDVIALRQALGLNLGITIAEPTFADRTASAVVEFQEKYASEALHPNGLSRGTGYVGPLTRGVLNRLYACPPPIIPPRPPVPVVQITPASLQNGEVEDDYSAYLRLVPRPSVSRAVWSVVQGELPPGLRIVETPSTPCAEPSVSPVPCFTTNDAILEGTPTLSGIFRFVIRAQPEGQAAIERSYSLAVYGDSGITPIPIPPPTPIPIPIEIIALNLSGSAVTVNGVPFLSHSDGVAKGLTTTAPFQSSTNVAPTPSVDADTNALLNTAIWSRDSFKLEYPISNGVHDAYLWIMENHATNDRAFDVKIESVTAATAIGTMQKGEWRRYGPYRTTVSDGKFTLDLIEGYGDPHLMGLEIRSVRTTSQPSITVLSPNGGEQLTTGQLYPVRWRSDAPGAINIYLSEESPCTLRPCPVSPSPLPPPLPAPVIAANLPNSGEHLWKVGEYFLEGIQSARLTAPPGRYKLYLTNSMSSGSRNVPFTIISSSGGNRPPVISGLTAPTTLTTGQTGTWTVRASDPENGPLTYSVTWGDERVALASPGFPPLPPPPPMPNQTSTFTHVYTAPGTYTPTFIVTDAQGLSARTSATVQVSNSNPGINTRTLYITVLDSATSTGDFQCSGVDSYGLGFGYRCIPLYGATVNVYRASDNALVSSVFPEANTTYIIGIQGLLVGEKYNVRVTVPGYIDMQNSIVIQEGSYNQLIFRLSKTTERRGSLTVKVLDGSIVCITTPCEFPVAGALVQLRPGGDALLPQYLTNSDGVSTVSNLVPGSYGVSVSKIGYMTAGESATVTQGQHAILTILLRRSPTLPELSVSVRTDKAIYMAGDPITIFVTAKNESKSTTTLNWNSGCQAAYSIGGFTLNQTCTLALTAITLGPGQSKTWEMVHRSDAYLVPAAVHSVVGRVIGDGEARTSITVRSGPPPVVEAVSPSRADIGTTITVRGANFLATNNNVLLQRGNATATLPLLSSNNNAITFPLRRETTECPICVGAGPCPLGPCRLVTIEPGAYSLLVKNINGLSNGVPFTITASTSGTSYPLTVSILGSGSGVVYSSPGAIQCSSSQTTNCSENYASGTTVNLTIAPVPAPSYFNGWGGACSGSSSACVVSMTGAKTVSADFGLRNTQPSITLVSPNGGENYIAGTAIPVRWTTSNFPSGDVDVQLIKAGVVVATYSEESDEESVSILLPTGTPSGSDYFVRVKYPAGSAPIQYSDVSNAVFTITQIPQSSTGITIGGRVKTTIAGLNVRSTATVREEPSNSIGTLPLGSVGTVLEGPSFDGVRTWWRIRYDGGLTGWSSQSFLTPIAPPPPLPPPPSATTTAATSLNVSPQSAQLYANTLEAVRALLEILKSADIPVGQ